MVHVTSDTTYSPGSNPVSANFFTFTVEAFSGFSNVRTLMGGMHYHPPTHIRYVKKLALVGFEPGEYVVSDVTCTIDPPEATL